MRRIATLKKGHIRMKTNIMSVCRTFLLLLCVAVFVAGCGCGRRSAGTIQLSPQVSVTEQPQEEQSQESVSEQRQSENVYPEEDFVEGSLPPDAIEIPPLDAASASDVVYQ